MKSSPAPSGDLIDINLGTLRNGFLTFTNASLSDCLKFAFGIVSDEQISGPDWIKSKAVRFDIVAQTPPAATREQAAVLLQGLLADRLKLTLHHEQKALPSLALVVAKDGPKIHAASETASGNMAARGHISGNRRSMQALATLLSRFEHETVLDKTGLTGSFVVKLDWTPDDRGDVSADSDNNSGLSLFAALQEQLGLRLESQKGLLDVLIIDHAEMTPVEN